LVGSSDKTHIEATFRSESEFGILGKIIFKENIIYGVSLCQLLSGYYGKIISDTVGSIISILRKALYLTSNGLGTIQVSLN
jgi:hypothetical protein